MRECKIYTTDADSQQQSIDIAISLRAHRQEAMIHTLRFQPLLKRIRWGGRRLGTQLGKPIGDETDYAESWEIVDHGDDQSVIIDGPYKNWTLARLVAEKEEELFGDRRGRRQFPLLVKFLDASDRLSVQVHPNDEQAKKFDPRENGKTEAWVIVDAAPNSKLYAGLKSSVDRAQLRDALAEDTVEDCLHEFPVRAGDCVFIPAGTVHAIGEGILLAEIQQSSDITFRLYDWGRVGVDGKPRPLHVDEALSCIDFDRGPVDPVIPVIAASGSHRVEDLAHCEYFTMRRHVATSPFEIDPAGRLRILMMLAGSAVADEGGASQSFPLGQTLLLPASADTLSIRPNGEVMTVLEAFLG